MPESVCAEKQAGKEETEARECRSEDSGKELIFDLVGRGLARWCNPPAAVGIRVWVRD